MKRTLLMVMAVALLLTQCRKPVVEYPTAGPANENMVSMTVTVGHGGKTDITDAGVITWSENDKLYVGDGEKYIGCLELQSGAGEATGTFTGTVSATAGDHTFGFYYLGRKTPVGLTAGSSTSVDISFASQTGLIGDLSDCHIGYGTATGSVDGVSILIDGVVTMTSKVAMAYFEFKDGETPYEGGITLSGDRICNSMTVGFNGSFSGTTGTAGKSISLRNTSSSKKYVMLVPPATAVEETLNFGGGAEGTTKFYKGIEANKFYCVGAGQPIAVAVTPFEFSVGVSTTVEFSPGNLYWDGSAFKFEENQWSFASSWDASYVSHFFWSNTTDWQASGKEPYAASYSYSTRTKYDVFFTGASGFQVSGETANTWRTLSMDEWFYLLEIRTYASILRDWKDLGSGIKGLVILPDGTEDPETVMSSISSTSDLATHGAVFLPAAGYRYGTDVIDVGSFGGCWSSTPSEANEDGAYGVYFGPGSGHDFRNYGNSVRLVR